MTQEEIDQLQSKTLEQFKSAKSFFVKGGAFVPVCIGKRGSQLLATSTDLHNRGLKDINCLYR